MKFYNLFVLFLLMGSALFYSCEADVATGDTVDELLVSASAASASPTDGSQNLVVVVEDCDDCEVRLTGVSNMIPASIMGATGSMSILAFGRFSGISYQNGELQWSQGLPPNSFPTNWWNYPAITLGSINISFPNVPISPIAIRDAYPNLTLHYEVRCPFWKDGNGKVLKYLYASTDIQLSGFENTPQAPNVLRNPNPQLDKPCPPTIEVSIGIERINP